MWFPDERTGYFVAIRDFNDEGTCLDFFFPVKMFTDWLWLYTVSNLDQTDFQYFYSNMHIYDTDQYMKNWL